jgi:hypothetical protein
MQTTIVARVADYVRDPDARKLIQKSAGNDAPTAAADVQISDEGRRMAKAANNSANSTSGSSWEQERSAHVSTVTISVQSDNYSIAPDVMDQIASRMVAFI